MIELKVKYFVFSDGNPKSGVTKKVISQVSMLVQLGLDIELILVDTGDVHFGSYDFLTSYKFGVFPKWNVFGRIMRARTISKIFGDALRSLGSRDVLFYRYSRSLPLYYPLNYLKMFRSCRIVTEHQTIEIIEFNLGHDYLVYIGELLFGGFLKKQSDGIVGVTTEVTQYEITCSGDSQKPRITIGNGFDIDSVPVKHVSGYLDSELRLLCVAAVHRWHGLDRLLKGIAAYSGTNKITLHIAGDGTELPYLKQLADELSIQDHIIFHGYQTGELLDTLFNHCHIAVGSLGIHRKGLTQTSELKAREYCARGIPYIIACSDPDFPDDFPYILRLPADESPIDMEQVITFASRVCQEPDYPQNMRLFAINNLDWSVKMKKLKQFLENLT